MQQDINAVLYIRINQEWTQTGSVHYMWKQKHSHSQNIFCCIHQTTGYVNKKNIHIELVYQNHYFRTPHYVQFNTLLGQVNSVSRSKKREAYDNFLQFYALHNFFLLWFSLRTVKYYRAAVPSASNKNVLLVHIYYSCGMSLFKEMVSPCSQREASHYNRAQ